MKKSISGVRTGCALQGALRTVQEIYGAVPILHSVPGCGISDYLAKKEGVVNTGYIEGYEVPATDVFEKQVIFGGGSRLREQIKNTAKVIRGDLYLILNSCESAMVGDDIAAMAKEAAEQGKKVIYCENTAGFKGKGADGYVSVFSSVIDQLPALSGREAEVKKKQGLVNLFGILPSEDVFFRGDLDTVTELLQNAGLSVNRFFGTKDGAAELERIPEAELNLVFSKWGVPAAEKLKEKYQTQYLFYPGVPVGPEETEAFIGELKHHLKLPEETLKQELAAQRDRFQYYLKGIEQSFYEHGEFGEAGIVGNESTVLSVGKFLKQYLGVSLRFAVITDAFTEEKEYGLSDTTEGFAEEIYYSGDAEEIRELIEGSEINLLLGSAVEAEAAKRNRLAYLEIAAPAYHQVVLSKSYAGTGGAVRLLEDYMVAITGKENAYAWVEG